MKKLAHFLKLAWKVSPSYILILLLQSIATSAQLLLNIYFSKVLVDELVAQSGWKTLALWGTLVVANNVVITWLLKLFERIVEVKKTYVSNEMLRLMSTKIMNLEYSYLEDPYYLDLKERAIFAVNNQNAIENIIKYVANLATSIFTVVGLVTILISLGWIMILAIVISLVLSLLCVKMMSKSMRRVMTNVIPINRKMSYYLELGMEKQYQKDIRLYNMSDMIANRTMKFSSDTCDLFDKFYAAEGNANGLMNVINGGISAFAYAYVGLRTLSSRFGPQISIGSLTMYVAAVLNFMHVGADLVTAVITTLQYLSFLDPYIEFMKLEEETVGADKELFQGPVETVEFKDVTFTYPKAEKAVLKNLSFEIHRGEKISIVGLNGAGKSTLVKLICRMYKADSGEILVNGKNIYEYDYMSYMKEIAAVFQDYKLFNFTIEENVSCQQENSNTAEVNRLIDEVGLRGKIDSLKNGIQSQFGKEYDEDGIEMSGGEGQKVAIARALYKESSMVILDEPASALDPIAEAEIYEKFNSLVDDKTAIYISHRMSSSVFCDKILIIDGGTVSDFDSHENLMKKTDSLYYKLFMAQADNYALN